MHSTIHGDMGAGAGVVGVKVQFGLGRTGTVTKACDWLRLTYAGFAHKRD